MAVIVGCPACRHRFQLPDQYPDTPTPCPRCGQIIVAEELHPRTEPGSFQEAPEHQQPVELADAHARAFALIDELEPIQTAEDEGINWPREMFAQTAASDNIEHLNDRRILAAATESRGLVLGLGILGVFVAVIGIGLLIYNLGSLYGSSFSTGSLATLVIGYLVILGLAAFSSVVLLLYSHNLGEFESNRRVKQLVAAWQCQNMYWYLSIVATLTAVIYATILYVTFDYEVHRTIERQQEQPRANSRFR